MRFVHVLPALYFVLAICSCQSQPRQSNKGQTTGPQVSALTNRDTCPAWNQPGPKLLLTGTILQADGITPAPGVMLYYYHTNISGRYPQDASEPRNMLPNAEGQSHGYMRGWVKTGSDGRYFIYTVRPGAYPGSDIPAHIHPTITEPGGIPEYYIDDFVFDDDKLVNSAFRKKMENRGGSGVLRLVRKGDLLVGERNIILGLNIPDHPSGKTSAGRSGRNVGEDIFSFTPFHAWGPDKGSTVCPICKYGWYNGVLYFVGNNPEWAEIRKWLLWLEEESRKRNKYLKVFFIYGNKNGYSKTVRMKELESLGRELGIQQTALSFVPSFNDEASDVYLNKISPEEKNTIIVYKRCKITDKYINLDPTESNFKTISGRLDASINEYFYSPMAE